MMKFKVLKKVALALGIVGLSATAGQAAVTQVEGAAGGGIVPWALISGGQPTASVTWVDSGEYTLSSAAIQVGIANRVELSYARQTFDSGALGSFLETDPGHLWPNMRKIDVDVFGAKVNLLGMSDTLPAVSIGAQYKETDVCDQYLDAFGSEDDGIDYYVAATKVFPVAGKNVLVNGTVRATKANQIGILGFETADEDGYEAVFEGSVGVFLNKQVVLGAEYRMKPDNIEGDDTPIAITEDDWWDVFIAYFPNENLSIVAAYASLGDIGAEVLDAQAGVDVTDGEDQRGLYLQLQANF